MLKKIKTLINRFRAIFFIIGLTFISVAGVIFLFNISTQQNTKVISKVTIKSAEEIYLQRKRDVTNMLSSTLDAMVKNEDIKKIFLSQDRQELIKITHPLFQHLKNQYRITHWYFLNPEPEKTCFLRVHFPPKHSELITRATFDECIRTKQTATGIELGKTAFALRSVHPYMDNQKLIGYMELGMEMEDFFSEMHIQTGVEYGVLVKKKFLDKEKWESVVQKKRIRNTWNDMENSLLIFNSSQYSDLYAFHGDLGTIPEDGQVLQKIKQGEKLFVRGIFPLVDAKNRKIGGVFILKDITLAYQAMLSQKNTIVIFIVLFMTMITILMLFFHLRAERELRKYRFHLEEMIEERTVELTSANQRLNLEIEEHKRDKQALSKECIAREEAEFKQIEAITFAERSTRLASIGVMTAGITHEINQPLNAIKVTADSIQYWIKKHPEALPEMLINQLKIVSKSVKRIEGIIQHMRAFWEVPDTSKNHIVDINKAVKNALSLIRQQLHDHNINERIFLFDSPLTVEGNLVHFEQIILNLLTNAINAQNGQIKNNKEVIIVTQKIGDWAELVIHDNGPGLPSKNPQELFDPFFTTRRNGEGMGLGLAIVKRYIDRYNGTIEASNNGKTGAKFTIRIPFCQYRGKENENIVGGG